MLSGRYRVDLRLIVSESGLRKEWRICGASDEHLPHDMSMHVRKPPVHSVRAHGEFLVINAQLHSPPLPIRRRGDSHVFAEVLGEGALVAEAEVEGNLGDGFVA